MPEQTSRNSDDKFAFASIEQLLEAEKAVEARLAEARETATRIVSDAYGAAQSTERQTDKRIAKLARGCMQENDRRVAGILAEAEEIGRKPVDTEAMRDAVLRAADALAARLTGAEP